jgi:hypothetical protein
VKYRGKGSESYFIHILYHEGREPIRLKTNSDSQCYKAIEGKVIIGKNIKTKYIFTQQLDGGFDGLLVELQSENADVCDFSQNLEYWNSLQDSDARFLKYLIMATAVSYFLTTFLWIIFPLLKI